VSADRTGIPVEAGLEQVTILAELGSAQEAAQRMLELLVRSLGWALGILWLSDGKLLRVAALWHAGDDAAAEFARQSAPLTFGRGDGLPGRVWESGEPLWIRDVVVDDDYRRRPLATSTDVHAMAAAPVSDSHGQSIGVVEVYDHAALPLDEQRLAELSLAGRQVGAYLAGIGAEQRLRESEERTDQIIRSSLDCIITMDHTGHVVDINPAAEATFGFTREQAVGADLAELIIPPALRAAHRAALTRYVQRGEPTILDRRLELTGQRADGAQIPVELTITRLGSGEPPLFAGFVRDITEQKREEDARTDLLDRERAARLRAEAAERQAREIASVLQRSLLPPTLPEIAGVELGAAYRPGLEGTEVGGDFYDVFELPGGEWGLMIGDVRGKGPEAATVTARVRHTVRAAAVRASSPSDVLRTVNEVMLREGAAEELCTAIYGRLDPSGEVVVCLSIGGHPLPVLLRAGGAAGPVGAPGTLLGVAREPALRDTEIGLEPGDALVMVTDGVQDSQMPDGRLGEERLIELVRSCQGQTAAEIAACIEGAVAQAPVSGPGDDVAVLVVRALPR
jgi:sigma-B regulation protein RsbU (phosphoserine phosphatase)